MSTEVPGSPQEQPPATPQQPTPEPVPAAQPSGTMSQDEKTMGMLCHLLALAGFVIPLGNIIGPLIVWLIKKDQYAFVNSQGKESLNFQISITIYGIVAGILTMVVIGIPLLIAVGIFSLVEIILASVKVNQGEPYTYPLTIRLIN